jgi:glutamine synthetase
MPTDVPAWCIIADDIERTIDEENVEEIIVEFPDIDGVARSKRVDSEYFVERFERASR